MDNLEILSVVGIIVGILVALGFKPPLVIKYAVIPLVLSISSTHLVFEYVVRPIARKHHWPGSLRPLVWIVTASICFGISYWIVTLSMEEEEEKEREKYNEKHPDSPRYPPPQPPRFMPPRLVVFILIYVAFFGIIWLFFHLIHVLFS